MIERQWKKISTNACEKGTYELNGWIIEHCGHPTANFPYMLYDPDGKPMVASNGRAHQTLAAAKQFAEFAGCTAEVNCER